MSFMRCNESRFQTCSELLCVEPFFFLPFGRACIIKKNAEISGEAQSKTGRAQLRPSCRRWQPWTLNDCRLFDLGAASAR